MTEKNEIQMFMHCKECMMEVKAGHPDTLGQSPREYARLEVGLLGDGTTLQVWCVRHEMEVALLDMGPDPHASQRRKRH